MFLDCFPPLGVLLAPRLQLFYLVEEVGYGRKPPTPVLVELARSKKGVPVLAGRRGGQTTVHDEYLGSASQFVTFTILCRKFVS